MHNDGCTVTDCIVTGFRVWCNFRVAISPTAYCGTYGITKGIVKAKQDYVVEATVNQVRSYNK